MSKPIQAFLQKYREVTAYIVFGALTTLVNYVVYVAWVYAFPGRSANVAATATAWLVSVLFAYFTNRKWVFSSSLTGFLPRLRECGVFFTSRAATGLLDLGIMYLSVDILLLDGKIMKLASNVLIIILNYILSKIVVFKK